MLLFVFAALLLSSATLSHADIQTDEDFKTFNGTMVTYKTTKLSQTNASKHCENAGSELLKIEGPAHFMDAITNDKIPAGTYWVDGILEETKFKTGGECTKRKVNFDKIKPVYKDFMKNQCVSLIKGAEVASSKLLLADCGAVNQFICWIPETGSCETTEETGTTTGAPKA